MDEKEPQVSSANGKRAASEHSDVQDSGTYMVVDMDAVDHWCDIQVSPFGCVPKADADPASDARVIHDLSYPSGSSINDHSDQAGLPPLLYDNIHAIARRIEALKARNLTSVVKIMRGDVKSAFRILPGHEDVCAMFAGSLSRFDAIVVDLALPFGWAGSPTHYGAFGGAISFLVRRESPASLSGADTDEEPFFCYEWVDDHVLIEENRDRLSFCESALRLAMLAVLGPRSINEKKFTL